jgi:hypothetical protein
MSCSDKDSGVSAWGWSALTLEGARAGSKERAMIGAGEGTDAGGARPRVRPCAVSSKFPCADGEEGRSIWRRETFYQSAFGSFLGRSEAKAGDSGRLTSTGHNRRGTIVASFSPDSPSQRYPRSTALFLVRVGSYIASWTWRVSGGRG